jgi:hypothetical protein
MAGAKAERIVTPGFFVRAASSDTAGLGARLWIKTSNIIFFVQTHYCKLRNILEMRSAVDERP